MTRTEVAKKLGVGVSTVCVLERAGRLTPKREINARGVVQVVHDPDNVDALIRSGWRPTSPRAGKTYVEKRSERYQEARAIRMLNDGKTPWEVAMLCNYTLDEAAELWSKWKMGPEGLLREKAQLRALQDEEAWARELKTERRRKEIEAHRIQLAELRKQAPAPVFFVRRDESTGKLRRETPEEKPE